MLTKKQILKSYRGGVVGGACFGVSGPSALRPPLRIGETIRKKRKSFFVLGFRRGEFNTLLATNAEDALAEAAEIFDTQATPKALRKAGATSLYSEDSDSHKRVYIFGGPRKPRIQTSSQAKAKLRKRL